MLLPFIIDLAILVLAFNHIIISYTIIAWESITDKIFIFCKYKDKYNWYLTQWNIYFKTEIKYDIICQEKKIAEPIVLILSFLFCICKKSYKFRIEIKKVNQVKNSFRNIIKKGKKYINSSKKEKK